MVEMAVQELGLQGFLAKLQHARWARGVRDAREIVRFVREHSKPLPGSD